VPDEEEELEDTDELCPECGESIDECECDEDEDDDDEADFLDDGSDEDDDEIS
jgi:hypothetical protein